VPLNEAYKIDVNPFEKTLKCSVHDAYFNIDDGLCVEGPCWNESLTPVAVKLDENGDIFLA
jgi:ketohexokinase